MINNKSIERIFLHNKCMDQIPFNINNNDTEGFIYCMETKFFSGYSQPIYKISSCVDIKKTIKEHESNYLLPVQILKKIKVKQKQFYEYMLILRLRKLRITPFKSFYVNIKKIIKYFEELEQLIETKTKEEIHDYYLKFMEDFDEKTYGKISLSIKRANELPMIDLNNKTQIKINLNSDDPGFIYICEHKYINEYYNKKIKIIICSKNEEIPWVKNMFIEDIVIKKQIKVKYINIAKNMIKQLGYNYNVKNFYYIISNEKLDEIIKIIQKYFDSYSGKFELNFAFEQRALENK
jgi:hypothetical protein